MRFRKFLLFSAVFFLVWTALLIAMSYNRHKFYKEKQVPSQQVLRFNPKVIGWIPFWDQEAAFESFSKNTSAFDFVSFFWYRVDASGNLRTYKSTIVDKSIIDFAHAHNVKVLAVVANLVDYGEGEGFDDSRVARVISTQEKRVKHINDLLTLVDENNLDGIDIDYEALKVSERENFSLFIEELSKSLHKKGKVLGVAIHPKTSENDPQENNGAHAQDLLRISKAADQMYFMTYTQHELFSEPGSIGEFGWIRRVLSYAIGEVGVPPEKVFLGIGLDGVKWRVGSDKSYAGISDDLKFFDILSTAQENGAETKWDSPSKSPYLEYLQSGQKYVIWFENSESASARFDLAKEFRVGGLAFWRLGGEDPRVWEEVGKLKN
ncbi:MAG: hypothetical protein A3B44_00350 [Candidatus Levybacteria bacterium RIFCSPLOWO2_01_FULL_38_21]|nr:MAG: hypothetical protein A3B44_00350 [Candidatus Levybacteria bacterium RIFCSPLOWO2_01_FULL_38_21]